MQKALRCWHRRVTHERPVTGAILANCSGNIRLIGSMFRVSQIWSRRRKGCRATIRVRGTDTAKIATITSRRRAPRASRNSRSGGIAT